MLHDVGKAFATFDHAEEGADAGAELVCPRVVWLVRHHLCLMRAPGATKRRIRRTKALADLGRLRRWGRRGALARGDGAEEEPPPGPFDGLLEGDDGAEEGCWPEPGEEEQEQAYDPLPGFEGRQT